MSYGGAKISILLMGVAEFKKAIQSTDKGVQIGMVKAIHHHTKVIEQKAHGRVPKRKGELASTIRSEFTKDGMVGFVKAGYGRLLRRSSARTEKGKLRYSKAIARKENRALQFALAPSSKLALGLLDLGTYGPVVEHGDKRRNKPAQPYLENSFREEVPAIKTSLFQVPMAVGRKHLT